LNGYYISSLLCCFPLMCWEYNNQLLWSLRWYGDFGFAFC
jgi:hypothetical protein